MDYKVEILGKAHEKKNFKCGNDLLDNYFYFQASQDIKRRLSACFVLIELNTSIIRGYYTLSNNSIAIESVPEKWRKKLPTSYQSIPTTLLGRLAVDKNFQGQGIGKLLLIDALRRAYTISKEVGSFAVVVDPIDLETKNFYLKYGFIELPDSGKLFISIQTLKSLFE